MNCDEWFKRLYQILDHDLDTVVWREVEAHMKLCRSCWCRFEFESLLKKRLKKSCGKESCTESFRARIKALLEKY